MVIDRQVGSTGRPARLAFVWPGLAVVAVSILFAVAYLRSTSRWWYEDDPAQYATAAAIQNPARIFFDPDVVRRFGTGASLVPMQLLSYWIDAHLFGTSPGAAYLHSLVSTVLTVFLMYLLLVSVTNDPVASACLALLWLLLPSTIAVHSFLSTRHYMEGLGWSLAACLLFDRFSSPTARHRRPVWLIVAGLCALAGLLSKELYVIVLPLWLLGTALNRRRYGLAVGSVLLALAYILYRLVILGNRAAYPVPEPSGREYLRYLAALPFTFAVNHGGYLIYALLAAGGAVLLIRRWDGATRDVIAVLALLIAALIPSYPTAPALLLTYHSPGTWYRSVFLINTVVLAGAGLLLMRHAGRIARSAGLAGLRVILIPGARETRQLWDARFVRSEVEGKFYLANPDKLVYSEEDAAWFLHGLDRLYGVPRSHYVNKIERVGPHADEMVRRFPTIWRYRDGLWSTDDALYSEIVQQNAASPPRTDAASRLLEKSR